MGTKYPDIWNALAAKFDAKRVKERKAGGGLMVKYITARTVMNRLDAVVGFENWWDEYERDPGGGENIVCRLTLRLPDGSTLTKCDAGSPGSTNDAGDDDKGAFSDAFKRAAVKFGVGRYLYRDGVYTVRPSDAPAEVPAPAPPAPAPVEAPPPIPPPAPAPAPAPHNGQGPPRTGRALFAWCKEMEQRHDVALLKYLNSWAKLQDFPGRMIDWDSRQVAEGHAEGVRKLAAALPPPGQSPPFTSPGGFREWAESRMAGEKAHAIGTELRFPGSWLTWTQPQCVEVWRALVEHEAEDAAMAAPARSS